MDRGTRQDSTTAVKALAVVIAGGAAAVAAAVAVAVAVVVVVVATTGDSWAVRSILVLVAGDVAVRPWRQ